MIEILRHALAITFYILFFTWIFLKLRNTFFVYKMNCKDAYREIKNNLKNNKTSNFLKYAKIFMITIITLMALYIASVIISFMLILIILVITGFGLALETEGLTWLNYILSFLYLYSGSIKYGLYIITGVVYIIFYTFLLMGLFIEYTCYKELKNINKKDDN